MMPRLPYTPTGWCVTMMRWLPDAAGMMSPSIRLASSANHDKNDEPYATAG